ncbi:MAG: hypothetical protein ACREOG_08610 [Gemmatimonadaceae bacterium]
MSWQSRKRWVFASAVVYLSAAMGACKEPAPAAVTLHGAHGAATVSSAKLDDVADILRTLKHLTVAYRDLDAAKAAGYDAQLTACSESAAGGQGFHYGSLPLFDAKVEPLRPEMLMYEPEKNGNLTLIGVEYAVPYAAWTSPTPPTLAGVPFRRNDTFQLYVLHAWIWNHNPSGVHADWNPRVTCQYAP